MRRKRLDLEMEAQLLGHEIEWIYAKTLAAESRRYKRDPNEFFDPLAATVLGDLIYNRMVAKR